MNTSTSLSSHLMYHFKSLFRIMYYVNKQTVTVTIVIGILFLQLSPSTFTVNAIETAAAQPRIRTRNNRNPGCDEEQQTKMQLEYRKCQEEFTQRHHKNTAAAITLEDNQKYTCQLLSDTIVCDDLMSRCHSADEVVGIKDAHVLARINQYAGNKDGIKLENCEVAKEYLDSGRGDMVDESTVGSCTHRQVNSVQSDFQQCSHQLSQKVWEYLSNLAEKKREEKNKKRGIEETETNDILEEEERLDDEKLNSLTETKPALCKVLRDIGKNCTEKLSTCISAEDVNQMRIQHIKQMATYYGTIYDGVDLSDCPALREFEVQSNDGTSNEDCDYYNDDGDYIYCPEDDSIYPNPPNDNDEDDRLEHSPDNDNDEDDHIESSADNGEESDLEHAIVPPPTDSTSSIATSATDKTKSDTDVLEADALSQKTEPDNEGNCNQAKYLLIAMTSVILSFLCN